MADPEGIYHWRRLDDRITTSGQPTEGQLAEIRDLGVRHIVNLALHTHEKALPDETASVNLGAMIIGLVGLANRWFMDALKLETELGRHLASEETFALLRHSAFALLFPAISAATIGLGSVIGVTLASGLEAVFYLGVLMASISVFLSSFVLDQRFFPALRRGSTWAALTLLLLVVRKLAA